MNEDAEISTAERLQIAQIVPATRAEGPGVRFAIWLQGCPLRCPGCCNPEMLPFSGGQPITLSELLDQIKASRAEHDIEGITLLGGEPFAHAEGAAALAGAVHQLGLSVMVFSGFTIEELRGRQAASEDALLKATDILVDGAYLRDLPEHSRRWIGSANQRIHFLSERYSENDACWQQPNTLEIRLEGGAVSVNGFPAASAKGIWQRPPKGTLGGK